MVVALVLSGVRSPGFCRGDLIWIGSGADGGSTEEVAIESSSPGFAGLVGVVVVAIAAGAWFGLRSASPAPAISGSIASTEIAVATITVHVSGAVVSPGLVAVHGEARVADALAAAGGAKHDADLDRINLASSVRDGDQIAVPTRTESAEVGGSGAADDRVAINTAGIDELQRLPGVGPVLATRIAEHRDEHGLFATPEDLLDVPGIGEAKLATMREALRLS